uniref:MADS16 n=1 Tax=Hippophae rhamnoides TaxID=193516 RepID=A0AAU7LJA7_9ROSA
MTKKKVKLEYITNDTSRKSTFKKRKKGFLKKIDELKTLCDIDTCAIIYSPYDSQPEVFPSPMGAQRVITKFKRMPQMEQCKKMVNQEGFIKQRISKINDQVKKLIKDNREKEMTRVMFQSMTGMGLHGLNMLDFNDLNWLISQNLKDIQKRMENLNKEACRGSKQLQLVNPTMVATPVSVPVPIPVSALTPVPAPASTLMPTQVDLAMIMNTHWENQAQMDDRGMERQSIYEMNMDAMTQRQPWFNDVVNQQENVGFDGEDLIMPFEDQNFNAIWSNPFFP